MAIVTTKGHVSRALDFFNKTDVFIGIGKTTAWTDDDRTESTPTSQTISDDYPPVPMATDELKEVAGYKKVESIFLVIPDDTGDLSYRDTRWSIVPYDEALDKGARWIYLSTYISYAELPTNISYRQLGCYSGLIRAEGTAAGKFNLLPAEVVDPGILEVIDNRKPVYREADQREQLVMIIEF